jgi:predicted membrane protein
LSSAISASTVGAALLAVALAFVFALELAGLLLFALSTHAHIDRAANAVTEIFRNLLIIFSFLAAKISLFDPHEALTASIGEKIL